MKRLFWPAGMLVALVWAADINQPALKMFAPLPKEVQNSKNPLSEGKIELGRMLYYEPRLSKSQEVSCNTCHLLDRYGADGEPVSTGHNGLKGNRNSPTVYNAAGHFVQFWDGRAPDVEQQAKGPVTNPVEMAMSSESTVIAVLKSIPEYVAAFQKAFPGQDDPVTFDNMAAAIGAFERKLVTPSRWDKFLQGDAAALTAAEKAGFNKFVDAGCAACHNGAYVGGMLYQKIGVVKPWSQDSDPGRYGVTKQEGERGVFKVPSLRNIEKTGPYFHTGKVPQLDGAVALMSEYQTGRALSGDDIQAIVTWLRSLTGEIPADYVKKPALPRSTARTPLPDRS
ncbi:MAG TPA: cytochrome c peroxidase [Bryobacteraceae bacterium]|nr:cytochrome c peroxidase [Bryobacteraceae bacterium]